MSHTETYYEVQAKPRVFEHWETREKTDTLKSAMNIAAKELAAYNKRHSDDGFKCRVVKYKLTSSVITTM